MSEKGKICDLGVIDFIEINRVKNSFSVKEQAERIGITHQVYLRFRNQKPLGESNIKKIYEFPERNTLIKEC